MFAKRSEIGILCQPFEIPIAERQSAVEGFSGRRKFAIEAMAARQIVKNQRITRLEFRQLLIHIQAALEFAALSIMITQDLKGFDVLLIAPNNSFHEADFDVQFA